MTDSIDGTHRAEAVSYEFGKSSKGNDQIGILFRLLDEPYQGRKLTWYGTFTEASFAITADVLRAVGWVGDSIMSFRSDFDLAERANTQVELVIETESYEGKERARIRFVNRLGVAMAKRLDKGERLSLAKRVDEMIRKGLDKRVPAGTAGGDPGMGKGPVDDDDIPF